ncbi:hypothetical protein MCOR25_002102 [Pyricularia grisea]|uniref:RIC1 C-terminal alpha solenoid region domain-containing protein n=1 Tax=Pyricularia grisea TaxID=148305 RepID=A0A6P8BCX7_PYRGI|nr:uncharacterized protein PgNI_03185 [Pyricularia grisea]KAI6379123.1 hypothetical protein MCOR25_002102 [Pyricularia grisea]TLD13675.1 hypothetical protein PgNI_03185 [Pyricularia grisea]
MYWPVGTPRVYATNSDNQDTNYGFVVSQDGLQSPGVDAERPPLTHGESSSSTHDANLGPPQPSPLQTPATPTTPITPSIKSVEHAFNYDFDIQVPTPQPSPAPSGNLAQLLKEPILALRVARTGHLFAVITSTTMTIWQTKPTVVLAAVVRSKPSIKSYGTNVDLLLRPDSAIFVLHTSSGYLITYSLATDAEARVYRPAFTTHTNVQRRRQSHAGGPGYDAPDQIMWGPGEGGGVRDVSVRFKMVIKVDAGIESALALDDELVVATRKPAAVQCIRWTPDSNGAQTTTEILGRMGWLDKKVTITEMTNDRPMNLSTWITSDGKAYAVQRTPGGQPSSETGQVDPKKLFKGYCFHTPRKEQERAERAVINARFSLIAIGCLDGQIRVYTVKDYAGNVPSSHVHTLPVSSSSAGRLMTLTYSPDGYCLFAGYEKGWATWSVYGKALSHGFNNDTTISQGNGEAWLEGVRDAAWIGGASEMLIIGMKHEAVWLLEMARSAVTGCYCSANLFRTVLQTTSSVMIYRGYDLPDLTTISAEPSLWHTSNIPSTYLLNQWPIRCTVVSPDGRYVAVSGRRGLAHYSVNSGRWKTFANEEMEEEFQVRGGMCWYQNVLVAAVEVNRTYELRLYSREAVLDNANIVHRVPMPSPVVLLTPSGEDSLLVYGHNNILYHFVFSTHSGSVQLVQVGHIVFHGIVRSPSRVRGLSWILPESQRLNGDPSDDVAVASVMFLVDGKLVILNPSLNEQGNLKYDMRVVAQSVEYYTCMWDQPFIDTLPPASDSALPPGSEHEGSLEQSLWMLEGGELRVWPDVQSVLDVVSPAGGDVPPTASLPTDFYPLSMLRSKGIILGVESELAQRRDINFSFFRFAIRTHLFLPELLRFYLQRNLANEALRLAQRYQSLAYFSHALEILLHHVLDEEVDSAPAPEDALLPRVLSLLSSFKDYLDVVVQCTRKTEVRSWRTLFAYLPPAQELFEESLLRGNLKTAGGYLLVLHTFDELSAAGEQSVRLLGRAMREGDWELCKELARFLAALDDSGETLREALESVDIKLDGDRHGSGAGNQLSMRLGVPSPAISLGPERSRSRETAKRRSMTGLGIITSGGSSEAGSDVGSTVSSVLESS